MSYDNMASDEPQSKRRRAANYSEGDEDSTKHLETVPDKQSQDPTGQSGSKDNTSSDDSEKPKESYAKSYSRVSKDNLYMIIALWMEDFVDDAPESCRKVGAVLVLPNDVIFAADCSRDGVHAVARLLMKHYDKAKGCKMFMSRKPCPFCAKLLVQSKVERVLFLPREPEYYLADDDQKDEKNKQYMEQVDNMFTASAIAQTRFVLQVEKHVIAASIMKSDRKPDEIQRLIQDDKNKLKNKYDFSSEWIGSIKKNLPWPAFDTDVQGEVEKYFDNAMNWMAMAIALPERELKFNSVIEETETRNSLDHRNFDPVSNTIHEKQAGHFMAIARFLAERTDDPKTGVGAVIVSPEMEILAFGWNGFPFKALYGEFARASKSDESVDDKKYPYVIHAEQNTLLMRNKKNIKGAILFVTKSPCNECTPLIAMEGIKTVVVDDDVLARDDKESKGALSYKKFPSMVKEGRFDCFQTIRMQQSNLDRGKESNNAKRHLSYE